MKIAAKPVDEQLRLQDLASYEILDTPSESDFDELVELAQQICHCPISLISLLDKDRQWFKAKKGVDDESTPRDVAFCSHAILEDDIMIVEDATKDARFIDNPFVTGDPSIRFYAGAPIFSPTGHKLGTICILDNKPKTLTPEEIRALKLLSNQVTKLLKLRKNNILIRNRAKEMIMLKSRVLNRMLQEQDDDKKAIAFSLHEDLAQRVASGILYLNTAEENPIEASGLIKTVKKELTEVLNDMRSLSYELSPPATNWLSVRELMAEFIDKIAITFPYNVTVARNREEGNCSSDVTLSAMRIIEHWLKTLANDKSITDVTIRVNCEEDRLMLLIEDDGSSTIISERHRDILQSVLYERVIARNGQLELLTTEEGKNALKIELPVPNEKHSMLA